MVRITATDEQVRQLMAANETVEFVDAGGNRLGLIAREVDLEDIRIARQRLQSDESRLPFAALLEHLATLESAR